MWSFVKVQKVWIFFLCDEQPLESCSKGVQCELIPKFKNIILMYREQTVIEVMS